MPPSTCPAPPHPSRPLCSGKKHTVVAGDSLNSIAQQYGTTPEALLKRNRKTISSAEQLQPGMQLKVGRPVWVCVGGWVPCCRRHWR